MFILNFFTVLLPSFIPANILSVYSAYYVWQESLAVADKAARRESMPTIAVIRRENMLHTSYRRV